MASLLALLEALGPRGLCMMDEITCLWHAARVRDHGLWELAWGNGTLTRWVQGHLLALGADWRSIHAPILAAMLLQAWAIARLGRRLGGPLVAQGALLAVLLSATFMVQARSVLPFAELPAIVSLAAVLALEGRGYAWLGGAVAALGLLEYEGLLFAYPGLLAFLLLERRIRPKTWLRFGAGFAIGLLLVLAAVWPSLHDWWAYRLSHNAPTDALRHGRSLLQVWRWLVGGDANAYLGVRHHSAFPTWALALAALGLGLQQRRRTWLGLWCALSLGALIPFSLVFEPQRAIGALPVLALAAGFGWRWAWQKARHRPAAAWALALLPLLGFVVELRAFERSMKDFDNTYASSQAWTDLSRQKGPVLNAQLLPLGWAWESIYQGPARADSTWIWVPQLLAGDAPAWPAQALQTRSGVFVGDLLLQAPAQSPLFAELDWLRAFWLQLPDSKRGQCTRLCRAALADAPLKEPLARAALWSVFFENAVTAGQVTDEDLEHFDRENFKSSLLYQSSLARVSAQQTRLLYYFLYLQRKHAGEAKLSPAEKDLLRVPWDSLPPLPADQPQLRKPA
jgi:hypothetical protein